MKSRLLYLVLALALMTVLAACGGGAQTQTPTPTPTTPSAGTPSPAATGSPASGNAAWDQIVAKAKQEGSVTIYGTGSLNGTLGQQIAEAFKTDTGISIEQVAGSGAPTYQRVQQELKANGSSADLVFLSPPWQGTFQDAGFYQSLAGQPLPVLSEPSSVWKIDPFALAGNAKTYVMDRPSYPNGHIVVNSSLLSAADYPTSFDQLATDSAYKGKIIWVDPRTTQDNAFKWTLWGYVAGAMSLKDMWEIYANQSPFLVHDPSKEADSLTSGQGAIAVGLAGFENAATAGAPIKLLQFPDVPTVSNVDTIGMVKNATHPDAALVFINWLLSNTGQQALSQIGHYRTLRTDVPDGLPGALAKSVVTGSGKAGPECIVTAKQALLPSYIYKQANSAWLGLTQGISESDFENAINNAVKQWETTNGPQHQCLKLG